MTLTHGESQIHVHTAIAPRGRLMRGLAPWSSTSRWCWLAAFGIMVLTLFLRLWRLDLVQFRDDQAALLRLAEDMVRLGSVPLAGMTSSIGLPSAPTFEYLLAPIVALSRDPRVASAAIGLANAAGVAGTLLLGWRWFSPLTGLVAGLVYATNPWAVFFARKVWSNDVLPPTAVVLLVCLDKAVVGGQVGWGVAAFPVFALGVGFHPSFVLLAPFLVVLGAVMARRGQLKHLAIGLGLAALTGVPYVIYNVQTEWTYLGALASPSGARPAQIDGAGPGDVLGLIGGWRNWNLDGMDISTVFPGRLVAVPGAIETLLLVIGIIAALRLAFRARHVNHRLRAAGLLLWVLVPMLLTLRHTIPLYDYYFLFVLPAGALLIGLGIQMLGDLSPSRRVGRRLIGAALAATIGLAAMQSVIVLRELGSLSDAYVVLYGPPLEVAEQTTRELIDQVNQSGARQLSVEIDDVNDVSIGYLARPYVPEVQVVARRRGPWNVDFNLPNQSGSAPYALAAPSLLTAPESLDVSYTDGVRVLSASTTRVMTPGESVGLALTWTFDRHAPEPVTRRLVWEIAVYDASGHELRRVAGLAHDLAQLADGEVVVSWIPVATDHDSPEGLYQVHFDRLDPVTRKPVPAIGAGTEWSSGTVEVRRK
jgi:4-amino-4-deoxy-L-arabinose transferase-like glycosyltransferase